MLKSDFIDFITRRPISPINITIITSPMLSTKWERGNIAPVNLTKNDNKSRATSIMAVIKIAFDRFPMFSIR
ncbi:hypothetical protein TH53_11060 [Pedobacter lusitanus]|uniref:Uncharacterized protein n=1 Tax=Pedobacter lusitanus TaxID=1503925 RepID=A0A0D0GLU2_9SPHI|nr:hypothetical protein TH53_11060 [Pedobacter lusitanus]